MIESFLYKKKNMLEKLVYSFCLLKILPDRGNALVK